MEVLREAKTDCICYLSKDQVGAERCNGLNKLCCKYELNPCPFYKSKYEYDAAGRPLKGINNGICRDQRVVG